MEYKVAHDKMTIYAKYIKSLAFLSMALLACNLLLGSLLWHQSGSEKIILVPPNLKQSAVIDSQGISASYLLQSALVFVDARLNVTPESIHAVDELILAHTDPAYYAQFKAQLEKEALLIQQKKVSSAFYIDHANADPTHLIVKVSGRLKRWVGERALSETEKTYVLHFALRNEELVLLTFREIVPKRGF